MASNATTPDPWSWWLEDPEMQSLFGIPTLAAPTARDLHEVSNSSSSGEMQQSNGNRDRGNRDRIVQCRYCRRPFKVLGSDPTAMAKVTAHEADCGKRQCPHCCTFFKTALAAQGHIGVCGQNALFRCQYCSVRCQGGQKKREHEAVCELNPDLNCEHCGKFFGHATFAKRHRMNCPMHPHRTCSFCGVKCSKRADTIAHEVVCVKNPASMARPGTCVACDKTTQCLQFPCEDHSYCAYCIRHMVHLGLKDRSMLPLRCCKTNVAIGDMIDVVVGQLLSEQARQKYQETMLLQASSAVMYCPGQSCGVLIVLDGLFSEEDLKNYRHGIFADVNDSSAGSCPKCQLDLCFQCRSEAHPGMSCNQYQFMKSKYADPITKFCRKMNWMRCFECGHVIEKKVGCNHITCLCGAQFCYLCGSTWGSCKCQVLSGGHALRHNRVPLAGAIHECPHCHQHLPSAAELRVHLGVCEAAREARGGTFVCNICQARFMNAQDYRAHRRDCFLMRTEQAQRDVDVSHLIVR